MGGPSKGLWDSASALIATQDLGVLTVLPVQQDTVGKTALLMPVRQVRALLTTATMGTSTALTGVRLGELLAPVPAQAVTLGTQAQAVQTSSAPLTE